MDGEIIMGICVIFLIPNLILAIWAYFDAMSRGLAAKSGYDVSIRVVLVLVLPILGIIIYLATRPKGKLLTCSTCRRDVLRTLSECPRCGASARPAQAYAPPRPVPRPRPAPVPPPKKELKCPNCTKTIQEDWKTCPHCGTKLVKEKAIIDEVFLMYRDGRLIKHFTRRIKPDVDQDILSSMLTAVQEFVKDTFKGEEGELDQMKFGRFQVMMGRGRYISIAAVLIGEETEPFRPQIARAVDDIEGDYEVLLRDWDGDVGELKVLGRYISDLIDGRYA